MKKIILGLFFLGLIATLALGLWALKINQDIKTSLKEGWFAQPVQIYTGNLEIRSSQKINAVNLIKKLRDVGWNERGMNQSVLNNEFTLLPVETCESRIDTQLPTSAYNCIIFKNESDQGLIILSRSEILQILVIDDNQTRTKESLRIGSHLFAQFVDDKAVRQSFTPLSQMPESCLESILAIEDDKFLEHKGISPRSIARAFLRNIKAGRLSEGGSTITQQLIKNKFLTNKKTLIRKAREAVMAILLEVTADKNKILESYLNIIYMGQDGPFEVRGFPAAAEFYFNKKIKDLNLKECASLAGSVKGPGIFGPHKEKNKTRVDAVLKRLKDLDWIKEQDFKIAKNYKLKVQTQNKDTFLAPYFVNAIKAFLKDQGIDQSKGLKVFTTLSADHQKAAETAAETRLKNLKSRFENPNKLEGLLVSADPRTGEVLALVGGSNFRTSPYNRVLNNFRPTGSIIKPFVYLSALIEDKDLQPKSLVSNEKYIYKDKLKTWSPANYDKSSFGGQVYLFQALALSLNIPTARVGLEHTNPKKIVNLIEEFGVSNRLKPYPALILGTFELYPLEILQLFSSLSQMGTKHKIHFVNAVEDFEGNPIYEFKDFEENNFEHENEAAKVIGMMKNTLKFGTAKSSSFWNLKGVYAGKTGTTSFHKDSWFAGFSKDHVAISWVGYDEGTGSKLSGASTALPLWMDYIRQRESNGYVPSDFEWPEKLESKSFSSIDLTEEANKLYIPLPENDIELVVDDTGWF